MSKVYYTMDREVWASTPGHPEQLFGTQVVNTTGALIGEVMNRKSYASSGSFSYPRDLRYGDCTTDCDHFMVEGELIQGLDVAINKFYARSTTSPFLQTTNRDVYTGFPLGNIQIDYPGAIPGDAGEAIPEIVRFRQRCLEDFNAKVQKTSSVSGAVFFRELHKTIEMIRNPAKSLQYATLKLGDKFVSKVSRLKPAARSRAGRETTRIATDLYLEFTYGVMPLILDIQGALDALKELSKDNTEKVCHSKRTEKFVYDSSTTRVNTYGFSTSEVKMEKSVESTVIYSAAIANRDQPQLNRIMSQFGMLPQDLPEVWWETTPFSFVVDYFYNINNLFAYSPDATDRVRYASVTFVDRYTNDYKMDIVLRPNTDGGYEHQFIKRYKPGRVTLKGKQVQRKRDENIGSLVMPHLRIPTRHQMLNLAMLGTAFSVR